MSENNLKEMLRDFYGYGVICGIMLGKFDEGSFENMLRVYNKTTKALAQRERKG